MQRLTIYTSFTEKANLKSKSGLPVGARTPTRLATSEVIPYSAKLAPGLDELGIMSTDLLHRLDDMGIMSTDLRHRLDDMGILSTDLLHKLDDIGRNLSFSAQLSEKAAIKTTLTIQASAGVWFRPAAAPLYATHVSPLTPMPMQ